MLTCLRVCFFFLEDLVIQSVAVPFLVQILYFKFTQSSFVFSNKIHFLKFVQIDRNIEHFDRKFFCQSFFAETFRD